MGFQGPFRKHCPLLSSKAERKSSLAKLSLDILMQHSKASPLFLLVAVIPPAMKWAPNAKFRHSLDATCIFITLAHKVAAGGV